MKDFVLTIIQELDISDILAFIAIVISIFTFWCTNKVSKGIANKELSKEYFDAIFLDFLLETFPNEILHHIELQGDKLDQEIYSVDVIIWDIIKKAKPYEYINRDFYIGFCHSMASLEESVYELIGLKEAGKLTDEQFEKIRYDVDIVGKQIYDLMKEEYTC